MIAKTSVQPNTRGCFLHFNWPVSELTDLDIQ